MNPAWILATDFNGVEFSSKYSVKKELTATEWALFAVFWESGSMATRNRTCRRQPRLLGEYATFQVLNGAIRSAIT